MYNVLILLRFKRGTGKIVVNIETPRSTDIVAM